MFALPFFCIKEGSFLFARAPLLFREERALFYLDGPPPFALRKGAFCLRGLPSFSVEEGGFLFARAPLFFREGKALFLFERAPLLFREGKALFLFERAPFLFREERELILIWSVSPRHGRSKDFSIPPSSFAAKGEFCYFR